MKDESVTFNIFNVRHKTVTSFNLDIQTLDWLGFIFNWN